MKTKDYKKLISSPVWAKKEDGNWISTKEFSPEIYILVFQIDARWRFSISGRVGTKYENYILHSKESVKTPKYGWKSPSVCKNKALEWINEFRHWVDRKELIENLEKQ